MSSNSPEDDDARMAEIMQRFEQQRAQCAERARNTLAALCGNLAGRGIDRVVVNYDGLGDSGSVEGVTAFAGEQEIDLPADTASAIMDAAYEFLPCGWEINEGSYGELVIDVPARRLTRAHGWRVETTEFEEQEFEL